MESKKIRKLRKGRFFNEGVIYFPLFDREIDVYVDFEVPLPYADKCVSHLETLSESMIDALCRGSVRYCDSFRDLFEELEIEIPEGISGREILPYIQPNVLIIEKPLGEEPAFHLECGCAWEVEHAMEWSVRGDTVLYVGEFCDENPWRDVSHFANAFGNYAEV